MSRVLIETLFFAAIAVFLILKFVSILGQKQGFEGGGAKISPKKSFAAGPLDEIYKSDPTFDEGVFCQGAARAFESILSAYAGGHMETLQSLLSPEIYNDFVTAIEERRAAGQTLESRLLKLEELVIREAHVVGARAEIVVEFSSEQVHVLRDKEGSVLEGDPKQSEILRDLWTFSRILKSRDPNWILVKTEGHQLDAD